MCAGLFTTITQGLEMKPILAFLAFALFATESFAADGMGPLIDSRWLAVHAAEPGIVIIDTRSHIPGAVHTDYGRDGWRVTDANGTPGMFPSDATGLGALADRIGEMGIDNDSHIVLVPRGRDEIDLGVATRIYWTFKVLGHDKVSILNGGMMAYLEEASRPLTRDLTPSNLRTFDVALRSDMLLQEAEVKQAMVRDHTLIDARPVSQFQGRTKSGAVTRPGTIPGARSLPAENLTRPQSGAFQSATALDRLFVSAGVGKTNAPILFCNTGHWASVNWFVASELLGMKDARLYDGSMAEWTADSTNSVVAEAGG